MSRSLSLSRIITSCSSKPQRHLSLRTMAHSSQRTTQEPESDPLLTKLEDAIHRIIARRSAPDWLPFLPGSSYWVPPPKSHPSGLATLLVQMANPLSHEESLSTTSSRGWPSSEYFIKGAAPHPVRVGKDLDDKPPSKAPGPVEVDDTSNNTPQSEDEEG